MARMVILTERCILPPLFLDELGEGLRAGRLAAFPTDTVYGLATSAESQAGIEAIYRLKGRPSLKPLPILVQSTDEAWRLAVPNPMALALAERHWPGPLTLVLKPTSEGRRLIRGHPTIGLRVPAHAAALEILRAVGGPLASTSANLSGTSATGRPEDLKALEAGVDFMVLEERPLPGIESTVVDLTDDSRLVVLRRGVLSEEELLRAGRVE